MLFRVSKGRSFAVLLGPLFMSLAACGGGGGGDRFVDEGGEEDPPIAEFSAEPTTGEAPLVVQFTDESSGDIDAWGWDFGDGMYSAARNPQHTFLEPGTYTVALGAFGPNGTGVKTVEDLIIVLGSSSGDDITASFDAVPTSGTAPLVVQFTDTSSGTVDTWFWDFGDGATSSAANPSHTYASPGQYSVSLTASGQTDSDSTTLPGGITVLEDDPDPPVASFNANPTSGVAPLLVQFTDTSSGEIDTWSWDFGDGQFSNQRNPSHVYATPGVYSVRLTTVGPGGTDSEFLSNGISVNEQAPVADFNADPTSGTAPLVVEFADASSGAIDTWSWDFGDGQSSNQVNPSHTYTLAGTFTVQLTVTGPGGSDTSVLNNGIVVGNGGPGPPTAGFSANPTSGAAPLAVQFTDTSSGAIDTWAWVFGDGATSAQRNPSHTYTTAGTYSVLLTVTGPGGTDTELLVNGIVVNTPAPDSSFSANPTNGDAPLVVQFTDTSSGSVNAWLWDFGDGASSTQPSPSHTYTTPGTYSVRLTVTGPGGADTELLSNGIVVDTPAPDARFTANPTNGDAPLVVQFTDTSIGSVTAWAWVFGDGATSSQPNPSHTYTTPGTYTVQLTATGPGGSDIEILSNGIVVDTPAPDASFNANPTNGDAPLNVQFTDTSTGSITAWSWIFGDGASSTQRNPSHTYTTPGTYTVQLTATGPGGADVEILANGIVVDSGGTPPTAQFSGTPTSGTSPLAVQFTDFSVGTIDTWAWDFGDGFTSSAANPSHTYTTEGTYSVQLTVSGSAGSDSLLETSYITVQSGASCNAEDASGNTSFPYKEGRYDFVQVTPDGRGIWCVYSVRDKSSGDPGVGNNVGIFLVELGPSNVLMFGAGYGDIIFSGEGPLHDAAFDMAMVDEIIQGCMGRNPATTTIQFWTPHGHPDHVHAAAMRELRLLNYGISDLYYHDADEGAVVGSADWTSQDVSIFRPISGPDCSTSLWSSPGDLGWIWVMRRSGHTSGSVDLVIDIDGDTNDRVVLLGSADSSLCNGALGGGVRYKIKAHGNILLP
ncbi:MAG: PKD repeat protein [Planctomycetota bacterium]|jgi:PKD repeat protein